MFLRRKQPQRDTEDDASQREAKVKELRDEIGPLSGRSLKYCTDVCLRRHLVARNWNVEKAKKMLEDTLKWRLTFRPEEIRWRPYLTMMLMQHEVAHEGAIGKVSRVDFFDRQGRTVLVMRPGKQNTTSAEGNIRYLVYLIENGILNLRENHYPERLAEAFFYNPPRFSRCSGRLRYFLNAKTFEKVKFVYLKNKDSVEMMSMFFDVENLSAEFRGKATLKYDREEFSKMMEEDEVKTTKFWSSDDKSCPIPKGDICKAPPQPINY